MMNRLELGSWIAREGLTDLAEQSGDEWMKSKVICRRVDADEKIGTRRVDDSGEASRGHAPIPCPHRRGRRKGRRVEPWQSHDTSPLSAKVKLGVEPDQCIPAVPSHKDLSLRDLRHKDLSLRDLSHKDLSLRDLSHKDLPLAVRLLNQKH